jgi:hypothetical protein
MLFCQLAGSSPGCQGEHNNDEGVLASHNLGIGESGILYREGTDAGIRNPKQGIRLLSLL